MIKITELRFTVEVDDLIKGVPTEQKIRDMIVSLEALYGVQLASREWNLYWEEDLVTRDRKVILSFEEADYDSPDSVSSPRGGFTKD